MLPSVNSASLSVTYLPDGTTTFHIGDTPPTPHRAQPPTFNNRTMDSENGGRQNPVQRPQGSSIALSTGETALPRRATAVSVEYRQDSVFIHIEGDTSTVAPRAASSTEIDMPRADIALDIPERETIASHLRSLIPADLPEDIHEGLSTHFDSVGDRLAEKGEKLEDIIALSKKALRRDLIAAAAGGAIKNIPSMAAGLSADFVPRFFASAGRFNNPVDEAATVGAQTAAFEHAADTIGCYALSLRLVPSDAGDRYYLAPKLEKLTGPAAQAQEKLQPTMCRQALNQFLTSQISLVRALVVLPVATAVDAAGSRAATAIAENTLNNVLRLPAGAVKDACRYGIEYWAGRYGPLWLFGRQDWEQVYDDLKASPTREPVANALCSVLVLPYDAVRHWGSNVKNFLSPSKLLAGATLVGGFSMYAAARAGVKEGVERLGANRVAGDGIAKAVSLPLRGIIVGAAETIEGPAQKGFEKLSDAIDKRLASLLQTKKPSGAEDRTAAEDRSGNASQIA